MVPVSSGRSNSSSPNSGKNAARICQSRGCTRFSQGPTRYCIAHGGGRQCNYPGGCLKSVQGRSFRCIAHGGGNRCQFEGCTTSARGSTGFCVIHGGGPRCEVEGCGRSVQGGHQVCAHHRRHGIHGLQPSPRPTAVRAPRVRSPISKSSPYSRQSSETSQQQQSLPGRQGLERSSFAGRSVGQGRSASNEHFWYGLNQESRDPGGELARDNLPGADLPQTSVAERESDFYDPYRILAEYGLAAESVEEPSSTLPAGFPHLEIATSLQACGSDVCDDYFLNQWL